MDEAALQLLTENKRASARTLWEQVLIRSKTPASIDNMDITVRTGDEAMEGVRSAFMSNQYTDMTIYCGNLTFNVHKVVVCPQSQVLKELDGEAESGVIILDPSQKSHIRYMIEEVEAVDMGLLDHIKIFHIGCQYKIKQLMIAASEKFDHTLKEVSDIKIFFDSICTIYQLKISGGWDNASGERLLGDVVIDAAMIEMPRIMGSEVIKAKFHGIVALVPEFWDDLMQRMLEGGLPVGPILCASCGPSAEAYHIEQECKKCGNMCEFDHN